MTRANLKITVVALSLGLSTAVLAQAPAKTQEKANAPAEKSTTVTGCVAAGSTSGTYVLNQVMADTATDMGKGAMDKGADAKAKAAPAKGSAASMPSTVMLMGSKVDFSGHVGHKVSVTGTMAEPGTAATKSDMGKADAAPMGHLTVASMKMVSTTCGM